jgi:Tol biopolymer transport system component
MKSPRQLVVCGLAGLAIAVFCTLDSNAQVQLPAVSHPIKSIDAIAITRDGRQVVLGGRDTKEQYGTWLRDLHTGAMTRLEIPGQRVLSGATFSPDGQWLGFWSGRDSTMRRVRVSGGPSITIGSLWAVRVDAMDWADDNRIVFSQPKRLPDDPLNHVWDVSVSEIRRVPATGGRPEPVVAFKRDEHIIDIHVLPGSRAALVTLTNFHASWIVAQPLDGGASRVLVPSGSHARYVPSKRVLIYRMVAESPLSGAVPLAAAPFDPNTLRLTGTPERLAVDARSTMAISSNGTLAHLTQPPELLRVFRDGSRRVLGTLPDGSSTPRVSLDGRRIAFSANGLWVANLTAVDSTARRVTLDTTDQSPVWSPDVRSVAFSREVHEPGTETSIEGHVFWPRGIYSIAIDGRSTADRLAAHGDEPAFWSPVTGRVAYERFIAGGGSLWTTAPGEGKSRQILRGSYGLNAALSRDGKWLAFEWRRFRSNYLYVSPFRSGGISSEIPVGEAYNPVWSHSGDELFFSKDSRVLVTRMRASASGAPTFSEPVTVYDSGGSGSGFSGGIHYDVMPDGGSVLVTVGGSSEIAVVTDVARRSIQ